MSYFDHFLDSPGTSLGNWIDRTSKMRICKAIRTFLPEANSNILELGSGWGDLAECFREAGYKNYVCVEPNPGLRGHLSRRGFLVKDYIVPPILEENNSYDAVILIEVFEHLNDARDVSVFMNEVGRVLRPGGIICIHSPDYLHWKEDFFNGDYTHSNVTTVRRTIQLFHNNRFSTLNYVYFSGFIAGPMATLMSHLMRFGLFFFIGNKIDSKLYKLKLTFLRQYLIIGANGSKYTE